MILRAKIIRIGNSRGVRIPRLVLEETGMSGDVELEVRAGEIIIRADGGVRQGWAAAFQEMASKGDDALLDDDTSLTDWDADEWEWE